jgi:hypothetical protein
MSNNFDFNLKGTSFNTLDRDLSVRVNHPDDDFNISNNKFPVFNQLNKPNKPNKPKEYKAGKTEKTEKEYKTEKAEKEYKTEKEKEKVKEIEGTRKIKYITTGPNNFNDFYSFGVKYGQNYNTDQESELLYSEATRSKLPKESSEYWDNTKRRNLDTSVYTNNPTKIQGRGFGNIDRYDNLLNGIGLATRGENPDKNPRSVEDDRIFLTNHNYNYDKYHTTDMLPCGTDTRYLNKKMI